MDVAGITREDWWECLEETGLAVKGETGITDGVSTALRSALTREWNKTHEDGIRQVVREAKGKGKGKAKTVKMTDGGQEQEEEEEEEEQGVEDF
jgi:hypothetical protein